MLFEEALKKARRGCGIYRLGWDNEDVLYFNELTNEIECSGSETIDNWEPTHNDIVASDWQES